MTYAESDWAVDPVSPHIDNVVFLTDGGDAPGGCAATVITELSERYGTQVLPVPFAQAPFRIHSDAKFSSVM